MILLNACSTKVLKSSIEYSDKTVERNISKKFFMYKTSIVDKNPQKLKLQFDTLFIAKQVGRNGEKIETIQSYYHFFPWHSRCLTEGKGCEIFQFDLFFGMGILMDLQDTFSSGPYWEKKGEIRKRLRSLPIEWGDDTSRLLSEPLSNRLIQLSIPELGYSKKIETDNKGFAYINIVNHLPEVPEDLTVECHVGAEKKATPVTCAIAKKDVAQFLIDYPRNPAILIAKTTPLKKRYKPCDTGKIPITIKNKGKGRAIKVIIEPRNSSLIISKSITINAIEPGKTKTINVPFQITGSPKKKKENLYIAVTEKFGNDANPIVIEVPFSNSQPQLSITSLKFSDGQSGLAGGNGNNRIENGELIEIEAFVKNIGSLTAKNVELSLDCLTAEIINGNTSIYSIPPKETRSAKFSIKMPLCYSDKDIKTKIKATIGNACFQTVKVKKIFPVGSSFPQLSSTFKIFDGNRSGTRGNKNAIIENGERIGVEVSVRNDGGTAAINTQLSIDTSDVIFTKLLRSLGDILPGKTAGTSFTFDTPRDYKKTKIKFINHIKNARQCNDTPEELVQLPVEFIKPELKVNYKIADSGNGNGSIEQGEECRILITVANTGKLDARNVNLTIESINTNIVIPDWKRTIGTIPAGSSPQVIDVNAYIKPRCKTGQYNLKIKVSQSEFSELSSDIALNILKRRGPVVVAASGVDRESKNPKRPVFLPGNQAPIIVVSNPLNNAVVNSASIKIVTSVITEHGLKSFTITGSNGKNRGLKIINALSEKQTFRKSIRLAEGENILNITATDINGKITTEKLVVTYKPASEFYSNAYAVLVGIDSYKDRRIDKLNYAVKDAKDLKASLLKYAGFKKENIIELYNEDATRGEILYQIKDNLRKKVKPDDSVFFFFAGHGETIGEDTEVGCLVAYNTRSDRLGSTGISISEIEETSRVLKSRHNLFILDSCFSGLAGFKRRSLSSQNEKASDTYTRKMMNKNGNQIITAGMKDERVIEAAKWKHSVFSYYLIKGIKGAADRDNNGIISSSELSSYLKPKVTNESKGKQTPQLRYLGDEGEYMFKLTKGES